MKRVVFDVETTGLPTRGVDGSRDFSNVRLLQVAHVVCDEGWNVLDRAMALVRPDGFEVAGTHIHGITPERAAAEGVPFDDAVAPLLAALAEGDAVAYAHNAAFDVGVLTAELGRRGRPSPFGGRVPARCTMLKTQALVGARDASGRVKWPRLAELYRAATGEAMLDAHDALRDVENLAEAMRRLVAEGRLAPDF